MTRQDLDDPQKSPSGLITWIALVAIAVLVFIELYLHTPVVYFWIFLGLFVAAEIIAIALTKRGIFMLLPIVVVVLLAFILMLWGNLWGLWA